MSGTEEIGCCGAYCGTCREYRNTCNGCKTGYLDGSRDLSRARCKMKKCCLSRGGVTCGDCGEYESCEIIQSFPLATNTANTIRRWSTSAPTATPPF